MCELHCHSYSNSVVTSMELRQCTVQIQRCTMQLGVQTVSDCYYIGGHVLMLSLQLPHTHAKSEGEVQLCLSVWLSKMKGSHTKILTHLQEKA